MVLGLIIIAVVILITDMTTSSEQSYYMIKEISEASMMEAVDYGYYRETGNLRINHEKFMENFLRRYSDVVTINKTAEVNFYDNYEYPPKITVEVSTRSTQHVIDFNTMSFDVTNRLDAILEMYSSSDPKK